MKPTTARRFGSLGRSFVAPAAAAAVMGAALIASDTTDTAQTVWSPAAACLLPDVLPVAGTLLSYGGNRQLAAGGTVTHAGTFQIGSTDRLQLWSNSSVPRIVAATSNIDRGEIGFTLTSAYIYHTSGQVTTRGTRLAVRSIDNTADAPITCAGITASGKIAVSPGAFSATGIQVDADSGIYNTSGNGRVRVRANGVDVAGFRSDGLYLSMVEFNAIDGVRATCLSQASAGVLQVGTTANNAAGSLMLTNLTASGTVNSNSFASTADMVFNAAAGTDVVFQSNGAETFRVKSGALGVEFVNSTHRINWFGVANINYASAGNLRIGTTGANALGSLSLNNLTSTGLVQVNSIRDTAGLGLHYLTSIARDTNFDYFAMNASAFKFGHNLVLEWMPNISCLATADVRVARNAVGQLDVRGNAGLRVRNIANNADADLSCRAITASGATFGDWTNWPGIIRFGGGYTGIMASSLIWQWNNSNVTVGGTPDLGFGRASGGVFEINNGTAGTLRDLSCRSILSSGAVQETPTQSALNPTTTNIPTGKRQGWYNSALAEFRDWVNIGGTLLKSAAYT